MQSGALLGTSKWTVARALKQWLTAATISAVRRSLRAALAPHIHEGSVALPIAVG
jgi:hypothetical protein